MKIDWSMAGLVVLHYCMPMLDGMASPF